MPGRPSKTSIAPLWVRIAEFSARKQTEPASHASATRKEHETIMPSSTVQSRSRSTSQHSTSAGLPRNARGWRSAALLAALPMLAVVTLSGCDRELACPGAGVLVCSDQINAGQLPPPPPPPPDGIKI